MYLGSKGESSTHEKCIAQKQQGDEEEAGGARWDADARRRHSRACSGKTRLSIQEKLDIIYMYYLSEASPSSSRRIVNQWDIAHVFGKSGAAISKLLKAENALKVMTTTIEGKMAKNRRKIIKSIKEEVRRKKAAAAPTKKA
ncbi:hypothetical protein GUITHDRAFT_121301 [Guillardia theta CCMP2712]|uniref:Uncharacterized protein n=1 Tax=Guillardia theta (strain CCMP2712) TaxID=905079 RepID=L1I9I3_GUITC|nr:hypothetical protein GUITHDRAFT_121301 [Guillardia theta CCMP2712]EKX32515.1 hypothetical protein GUITHDRAFT_121301 [Guillardia theta CCMP2712]|eukprot:XP_005819495.1 hypothetical protein GUITHDRAFT_121301 [Guillardia theta CCMP2712]